jgi:BASS family bile acid:Na+ symporter
MDVLRGRVAGWSHFLHHHFLWLLVGSYALAAVWPAAGLAVRRVSLGGVAVFGSRAELSAPVLMLAFLILNAGFGVRAGQLRGLARRPIALAAGLTANLLVPVAYVFAVSLTLRAWHNPDEVQHILVGLALVASVPIAGSSTAWAQNADGDLALSLGLVLGSTLLSPGTTPAVLHAVGWMADGDYAEDLHELAAGGAGGVLAAAVVVPSLLGMAARRAAGERTADAARPTLKLLNAAVLLLLNYSNAAVALPRAVTAPDWDFLAAVLAVVAGLCGLAFAAGCAVAWWAGVDGPRRASLVFGLGMNNNGTGLVLAAVGMADHPEVVLPVVVYNLVQHLAAGVADRVLAARAGGGGPTNV